MKIINIRSKLNFLFFSKQSISEADLLNRKLPKSHKRKVTMYYIQIVNSKHDYGVERSIQYLSELDLSRGQVFREKVRNPQIFADDPEFIAHKTKEMNKSASKRRRTISWRSYTAMSRFIVLSLSSCGVHGSPRTTYNS